MKSNKSAFLCVLALSLISRVSYSADLEYPELQVSPRASDRLQMEANDESARQLSNQWIIAGPALATLVAGIANDPTQPPGSIGTGVGAAWLAISIGLASMYHPYAAGLEQVSKLPKGSTRESLTRERLAEEALNSAASLGTKLRILFIATNLATDLLMAGKATYGSFGQISAGVAAGLTLAPILFRFHWNDVADQQAEYKKRIYGPVASATLFPDGNTGRVAPGFSLAFRF